MGAHSQANVFESFAERVIPVEGAPPKTIKGLPQKPEVSGLADGTARRRFNDDHFIVG
jgi:hypothetical protein